MQYLIHILIVVSIYAILSASLDLQVGQTGLLSICQAAFYGTGAYGYALTTIWIGSSLVGIIVGLGVAAVLSLFVSLPAARLRGDYFFMATFSLQLVVSSLLNNWQHLTRGPLGVGGIPALSFFGVQFDTRPRFGFLVMIVAFLTLLLVRRVGSSPMGRVMKAIRDDEKFAEALGKNTSSVKIAACALSAVLAALAGVLYAAYITYIDPTSFGFTESLLVLSMVIIGGAGSIVGSIVGSAILILLPELLRFMGLPTNTSAILRQISYGSLLVLLMFIRPKGIFGRYGFGRK